MVHAQSQSIAKDALSVLVVEDNKSASDIISGILKAAGIKQIRHARDGSEAMEALKDWHPSAIITDWNMKPMNGKAFLHAVRSANDELSSIPMIVATGYASKGVVFEALKEGAQQILSKPISPALLYEKLGLALKQSNKTRTQEHSTELVTSSAPQAAPTDKPEISTESEVCDEDEAWQI